jgi:hypothetical protein
VLRERVLAARTQLLGPEHPGRLTSAHDLGVSLCEQGDLAAADRHVESAYRAGARGPGPTHPDVPSSGDGLERVLDGLGEAAAAALEAE